MKERVYQNKNPKDSRESSTMAIALRRALISSRNLSLLLRTSSLHSPDHSHFASSPPCLYNSSPTHAGPNFPAINFNGDTRRGFAKGRKSSIPLPLSLSLYVYMYIQIYEEANAKYYSPIDRYGQRKLLINLTFGNICTKWLLS